MRVYNLLFILSTLQCQIRDVLQHSLKGREFQLAVIQVDRGHRNPTAWNLPGTESTAVMSHALLFYGIWEGEGRYEKDQLCHIPQR